MIPSTSRRSPVYTGTGAVSVYSFSFKVFQDSDIKVQVTNPTTGVTSTLTLGVDYTVSRNADQATFPGGTVNLTSPLTLNYTLVVIGNVSYAQTSQLPTGGAYNATVVEQAMDRLAMQTQQLAELASRSLTLPATASGVSTELPGAVALKVIGWNLAGTGLTNYSANDLATIQLAVGNYVVQRFASGVDFTGGVTTSLNLSGAPGSVNNCLVTFDGAVQHKDQYSVNGVALTFTAAIPAGVQVVEILRCTALDIGVPSDGTVTNAKLGNLAVATINVQDSAITTAKIADANVTTAKLADGSVTPAKMSRRLPSARSSNTALAVSDLDGSIIATGTFTQTLAAAATLGNGWFCQYINAGTGIITFDPNGAELMNGLSTVPLFPGEAVTIVCDGVGFQLFGQSPVVLIQRQTLSVAAATIDFTSIFNSVFDEYELSIDTLTPVTNGVNFLLTVQIAAAWASAGYSWTNIRYDSTPGTGGAGVLAASAIGLDPIGVTACSNAAPSRFKIRVTNCAQATARKSLNWEGRVAFTSGSGELGLAGAGYTPTGAITGFRLAFSAGNIAAGAVATLRGLR